MSFTTARLQAAARYAERSNRSAGQVHEDTARELFGSSISDRLDALDARLSATCTVALSEDEVCGRQAFEVWTDAGGTFGTCVRHTA